MSTADNLILILASVCAWEFTKLLGRASADVWDTWLGSARRCGCDKTTPTLTPTTPLAYTLHGQPVEVGEILTIARPGKPVREGEFRGINANTQEIRCRLWSPSLGRFSTRREYCNPAHVTSVTATLDPSMLGGRLVAHRERYGVSA